LLEGKNGWFTFTSETNDKTIQTLRKTKIQIQQKPTIQTLRKTKIRIQQKPTIQTLRKTKIRIQQKPTIQILKKKPKSESNKNQQSKP